MEKHGVINVSQTPMWKEKVQKTNLERYGVNWFTQHTRLHDGIRKYVSQNNQEILQKREVTNLKRYGVPYLMQAKDIAISRMEKYVETSIEKYGTRHPRQDSNIFSASYSSFFKKKDYVLPSGKVVKVQGYENIVLDELFSQGYLEEDILITDNNIQDKIGMIFYEIHGKVRRYFPDIYIISENKIVEVKSDYTFNLRLDTNYAKRDACISAGFNFSFEIR
jgi:hypothetical protein